MTHPTRIAITGSSGLIRSALSRRLTDEGHEVVPVVRHQPKDSEIGWSVEENRIDSDAFDGIDAVVHLAGAGIGDHRWTDDTRLVLLRTGVVMSDEGGALKKQLPTVQQGDGYNFEYSDLEPALRSLLGA